ncbi:glucuronate isomerase [bacterium]
MSMPMILHEDRYFSSDPVQRDIARKLYQKVKNLPLICPHSHVDPQMLFENKPFPDPTELLVIPDHYLFRMLYSQGIPLESLGIPRVDGGKTESDRRKIWQIVGDHFYLFRGTPTGMWLKQELKEALGVDVRLSCETAMEIYDQISENLVKPENLPRSMFERFNIEVLCTTDWPTDQLIFHQKIKNSDWNARVLPSFRPDNVIDFNYPNWKENIDLLAEVSGKDCGSYSGFIQALEKRREFFKSMGCVATDHGVVTAYTGRISDAEAIYQKALKGKASEEDNYRFTGHMLMEMARMSLDDGMTMQIHAGVYRDHNSQLCQKFGKDKGCDIPMALNLVTDLKSILNEYGNDPRLTLILFSMDETTYSREAAPLAGHYPALKLGPAWWFHDSREGMLRFRRMTTESAGIYNTVGFNDDTRAFPSIPSRHDLARRIDSRYLAELVSEHVIDMEEAEEMITDLAYHLPKQNYKL